MRFFRKKRIIYTLLFLLFLFIEVLIGLFVRDNFVRPYVGDMLVVVVIYFFIRIFLTDGFRALPAAVFVFAVITEVLQYFNIVRILGLEGNRFLSIVIGSTFDIKDIICYAVGCTVLGIFEYILYKKEKNIPRKS
ncbi:MAG: DUF2809 domain-containing protein [Ruminococcaceae bacterium]|nr:DUF2809 domain-containing protein [Oscillospiraceae bacterium]